MFKKHLLFVFFSTITVTILSQTYNSKNYTINDKNFAFKLPSSVIRSMYLDSKNFLWIGTDEGLCKFDGKTFKTFTKEDGLLGKNIWAIAEDKDGNLWISSFGKGLNKFDGTSFTHFTKEDGLAGEMIRTLSVNDANHILIGCDYDGLSIYHNNQFENFPVTTTSQEDYPGAQIMDFFTKNGEQYFVAFNHGIYKINNKNGYSLEQINSDGGIEYIESEETYLYATGGALYKGRAKEKLNYKNLHNGENRLSRDVIWDSEKIDNNIYLGSWNVNNAGGGLFRWSNNKLESLNSLYNIKSTMVWSLEYDDASKTLWIGTLDKGLYSIDLSLPIKHISYNLFAYAEGSGDHKYDDLEVIDIKRIKRNRWILTNEGIIKTTLSDTTFFKQKKFQRFIITNKTRLGIDTNEISLIKNRGLEFRTFRVIDNRVYVMTDRGIFSLTLNGKILNLHQYGNAVFELYKGKELLTPPTYGGFHVYKPFSTNKEERIDYNTKDINSPRSIRNSINTGEEVYLASRDRGLFVYKDGKSTSLSASRQFKNLYPTQLHYKEKDTLYVSTAAGDIYIANIKDTFIIVDSIKHKEIIGNKIKFIETWKKLVIVGTNEGINFIDERKKAKRFIDEEQGIFDKTFSCSLIDNDSLSVYTEKGGYYVIPMKNIANWGNEHQSNKTTLTSIKIDSREVLNKKNPQKEIKVEYYQNSVELHLKLNENELNNPNKIRIRYRINYNQWTDVDEMKIIVSNFMSDNQNREPGEYVVQIKINNLITGAISERELIKIIVKKPFWTTIWFWSIIIVAFSLLVIEVIKREKQKARLKNQLIKAKLEALRSQMNPHFIFNSINSIQNYIIDKNVDDALMYMGYFSALIRQTLDNSTHSYIPLFNVIDYLETYIKVENIRFDNKIKLEVESEDIDLEKTSIPPMLIQPLVENAIVHGLKDTKKEFKIKITFTTQDKHIKCSIHDNGAGFDINKKEKSKAFHALEALKERVSLLQGKSKKELEISSNPAGTTIILLITYNTIT